MKPLTKFTDRDKEVWTRHAQIDEVLFTEKEGKWYNRQGEEIQLEVCSLEELIRVTDRKLEKYEK